MTISPEILPIDRNAAPALLALNEANVEATSPLDLEALRRLLTQAFYARLVAGNGTGTDAFLLASDQDADYAIPNFLWFKARQRRFVYVDRIVVAADARGRGYARRLYADLFRCAREAGHDLIVCEVNVEPPNPASDAFHAALGFTDEGRARLTGAKTVRYLSRGL